MKYRVIPCEIIKYNRKESQMRKLVLITAMATMAISGHADLYWASNGTISNELGVPLASSFTDSSIGCFAQLIFTGANGTADLLSTYLPVPVTTGSWVSGDDVVVATMFCGQGNFLADFDPGNFVLQGAPAVVGTNGTGNGDYYVRVYNSPSLNFGGNDASPIGATYYFQSEEHTYTHNIQPGAPADSFYFAPNGGATLLTTSPIPEPAALGLGIIGLISLRLFSSKRKS